MQVVEIGQTAMKKPQLMAIITAPANFAKLERYKEISRRLSLAEGLTDEQARALAKEGKSVVWIDGGLHASEVLGAQQLMEMVYQMVSRTDEETMRFLNDVIILFVPRESGRPRPRRRRVHEAHGHDRRPSRALQLLRGPRQQPRLVHERAAGDHEHEPDHVSRVVPADHVQPSPVRSRRAR